MSLFVGARIIFEPVAFLLVISRLTSYREIPKISPSMYKPPQTGNAKNPPLNGPSKYKPPWGLVLGKFRNTNFPP